MATRYLERLEIEAFRGISGLVLEDLAAVNIVVGANNTGKTSVLEAASLALRAPDAKQWIQTVRSRESDEPFADAVWSLFPKATAIRRGDGPQTSCEMNVRAIVDGKARTLLATAATTEYLEQEEVRCIVGVTLTVDGENLGSLEFGRGASQTSLSATPFRVYTLGAVTYRSSRVLATSLTEMIDRNRKSIVLNLLHIFDADISDINVVWLEGVVGIRVTHANRGVVDLSSFGDGMRRSVAMALMLARATNGLLLIDEIETGIHPTALVPVFAQFLAAAKQANVQILATTHSIEALDALAEAAKDLTDIAAYRLHRRGGGVKARRYEQERLTTIRKEGLDVR